MDMQFAGVLGCKLTGCSYAPEQWPRWDFGCSHHKLGELVSPPASYYPGSRGLAHSACLVHRQPGFAR